MTIEERIAYLISSLTLIKTTRAITDMERQLRMARLLEAQETLNSVINLAQRREKSGW